MKATKLTFISSVITTLIVVMTMRSETQTHSSQIGVISTNYLFNQVPELVEAKSRLDSLRKQLQSEVNRKNSEYKVHLQDFEQSKSRLSTVQKERREQELQREGRTVFNYRIAADNLFKERERQLTQPIIDRIQAAIARVAQESGYTHIINRDGTRPLILYMEETSSLDGVVLDALSRPSKTTDKK